MTGRDRAGAGERTRQRARSDDDRPVLPSRPDADSDASWGDEPGERDDDWYRRERPPHHE